MGFDQGIMPSMLQNQNMLSFQSGSGYSNPQGIAGPVNLGNSGLFFTGNPSLVNNSIAAVGGQAGASSSNTQLEPVPGIRQDSGLSLEWTFEEQNMLKQGLIKYVLDCNFEWTFEEQNMLKQGLIKYAGEHGMMKYIKIAAMMRRKTVRDVALRCRWLARILNVVNCYHAMTSSVAFMNNIIDGNHGMQNHLS
ncbi:uncharacterized protein A4U43_C04F11270 [Asparagus officinalis]|uniref:Myb-like domain-containing protein n=1 Tax=Asparagus officinalis TaxID=4686 RepID=A0A5P1F1U3_ASPOF|nr:uncharacterized protein A4U43_C04F11270 [Asparagus officinalis]